MDQLTEKTIYRDSWNKCRIEIIEDGDNRSLYFGGNVLQSTMSISTPQRLVLSYTRYMMTTLLFVRALQRVLVVGVGAGSLIRFIHHHCPDCIIDGVDSSARILQLARGYFNLPDSGGVRLHCCDGREFLADRKNQGYDLVLVDAFDQEGMAASIYCAEFFSQCHNHLQKNGIISLNLWSGDTARLNQVQSDLERHYNSCYTMPVPDRGNIVCLAAKESDLKMTMERDYTELARMGAEFDINFNEISRVFNKHNLGYRERLFRFFC